MRGRPIETPLPSDQINKGLQRRGVRVDRVSRILSAMNGGIIYLGSASPPTSSGVPGAFIGTGRSNAPASPCSRWGLAWPATLLPLPVRSCRTLSPSHPAGCNLLSVALAVRLPCPAVSRHRRPVECGLSSTGLSRRDPLGQPGHSHYSLNYPEHRSDCPGDAPNSVYSPRIIA